MAPSTPKTRHQRTISSISTPGTPETGYVMAAEELETPTKPSQRSSTDETPSPTLNIIPPRPKDILTQSSSSSSTSSNATSANSDLLEMLDNSEEDFSLEEDTEEALSDVGDPLVSRGRRRRRKKWDEQADTERSLFELIPPLLVAHPLPLLPLLPLLPFNFLPAGTVLFIPFICVLALLSSCAHIVIVYLAWYLKVSSFEEVFASVTGKFGQYGQWAGRAAVITSTLGLLIGWMETFHPLLSPVIDGLPGFLSSRILWTIVPSLTLLPSLLPSRMTRSLRQAPIVLALLIPVVAFLLIGRTVEITKAAEAAEQVSSMALAKRRPVLGEHGSAGAGLTALTIFLSPQLNTLPIHATLSRNKRASFPLPCLLSSAILLALSLPLALVPYYLLPSPSEDIPIATPTMSTGVFARLPADDGWINLARVLQCALSLGSCNMWLLRCRDSVVGGLNVDRAGQQKAARWTGIGLWTVVVILACLSGWIAEKVELLGVISTLAIGWLLPSVFFIITFHVRSPLSIVFPSRNPPPPPRHARSESLTDPSIDVLLARKERQLQKRRLGRRLWQDLIVYIGILPVGCITIAWSLGSLLGIW